jgi:hypothetical protein
MGYASGAPMPLRNLWKSCTIVSSSLDTEFTLYCSGFEGVEEAQVLPLKAYCNEGRLVVVLPVDVSSAFLQTAARFGLHLHKRMTIIPIVGKEPNRVNLELRFGRNDNVHEETFVIRDADKRFTSQYNEFLKDYYLGL